MRIQLPGQTTTAVVSPSNPSILLDDKSADHPALAYLGLGFHHIFEGADHLVFVLGLFMLIGFSRQLFYAITAFTFSHSITLFLVTAGVFQLPPAVVEALVAISIVLLAREVIRKHENRQSLATRMPWLMALLFGLVHGFAFAGALAEIGFPAEDLLQALLLFNLGVELGQVVFIAGLFALLWYPQRMLSTESHIKLPQWARSLTIYWIGIFAALLTVERLPLII